MTRDDIIRMAREAGLPVAWISDNGVLQWNELTRFAALISAAEREACAKVCADLWCKEPDPGDARDCYDAIRARSEDCLK